MALEVYNFDLGDSIAFGDWLKTKGKLSESTIYGYVQAVNLFFIRNPNINNSEDYNQFLIECSIKKRSYLYYFALKLFIDYKIDDVNIKREIKSKLIKPVLHMDTLRERKHLSEDELYEVINNIKETKHKLIAIIQSLTGVRAGDIMKLRDGDVVPEDYNGESVLRLNIIGKGKKRNVVFLYDEMAQNFLIDYIVSIDNDVTIEGTYFIDVGKIQKGRGVTDYSFKLYSWNYIKYWMDLKFALEMAGVRRQDFATHDFRRCFARRVWEKFKDVYILQKMLNHSDPKVTLRYLNQSGLQNADYHRAMQL
jgi:integrase